VPQDEGDPLRRRDGGERDKRSVVDFGRRRGEHRLGLDSVTDTSLLTTVMIEQLVPRNPVDPGKRRIDASTSSQFDNRSEKRLLRQVLGNRNGAAGAVEQIAVHARESGVIEAPEAVGLEAECLRLTRQMSGIASIDSLLESFLKPEFRRSYPLLHRCQDHPELRAAFDHPCDRGLAH
jgi:hypothetical protein